MKVIYDIPSDTLNILLIENAVVSESDEDKPGIILDYDGKGNLVSIEILDASKKVTAANKIEFQTMAG
jgi:YD repeat-containing protein